MMHVCPTDVVHAPTDHVWHLLTTPRELAGWTDTTLVESPAQELREGDRVVLGAGIGHRLRVIVRVREAVRPQVLSLDIRLPFGVTNAETIDVSPIGARDSRITFN